MNTSSFQCSAHQNWKRTHDYFDDLDDYFHEKQGIEQHDFWPTVNKLLHQNILIEKNDALFFKKELS
jgi:hypothetical protein